MFYVSLSRYTWKFECEEINLVKKKAKTKTKQQESHSEKTQKSGDLNLSN